MAAQLGLLDFNYPQLTNLDRTVHTTQFDPRKFNALFRKNTITPPHPPPENISSNQTKLEEFKNVWFDIIDEIINGDITVESITEPTKLYYIGLTVIIFVILLIILDYLFQ